MSYVLILLFVCIPGGFTIWTNPPTGIALIVMAFLFCLLVDYNSKETARKEIEDKELTWEERQKSQWERMW